MTRWLLVLVVVAVGCKASSSDQCPADSTGGAVTGPADSHCTGLPTIVNQNDCHPADAGVADANLGPDAAPEAEYGATMYGNEGDDDDCKYHVVWSSSPICDSGDVTFTITVTSKADGTPILGAQPQIEALLNPTTPAMDSGDYKDLGGGTYTISPVRFGTPGQWLVRFHLFEMCSDEDDDSPHGHAAFFVDVP